jgi:Ca2+-binding EF-hand superfamily protein
MSMKNLTRYSMIVLALALPVSGYAGDSELFKKLDTDKNSSISKDELLKSDLVIIKDAQGKQNVVHRDMAKDAETAAMTEEQKKHLFDQIDTDKNGYINRKEWSRASQNGFILWKF